MNQKRTPFDFVARDDRMFLEFKAKHGLHLD
jgi:hypothetical protein